VDPAEANTQDRAAIVDAILQDQVRLRRAFARSAASRLGVMWHAHSVCPQMSANSLTPREEFRLRGALHGRCVCGTAVTNASRAQAERKRPPPQERAEKLMAQHCPATREEHLTMLARPRARERYERRRLEQEEATLLDCTFRPRIKHTAATRMHRDPSVPGAHSRMRSPFCS
jgi:hypothetical protein